MLSHVPEFPSSFKTPTVCVCAHMCMHITYIYLTFCLFINSFTGGHLGCFHLLVIMKLICKLVVEITVQVPAFTFFFGIYPEAELLDHIVI